MLIFGFPAECFPSNITFRSSLINAGYQYQLSHSSLLLEGDPRSKVGDDIPIGPPFLAAA